MSDGHWMEKAFANAHGQLHRELGVPVGKKIPAATLAKAKDSSDPKERQRANLAAVARRVHSSK